MMRRIGSGPAEGWLSLGLVLVMCVDDGVGHRRRRPGHGPRHIHGLPDLGGHRGRPRRLPRSEGRAGPLAHVPRWRASSARWSIPWLVGEHLASDGLDPRPLRGHRPVGRRRPTSNSSWKATHSRTSTATTCGSSGCSSSAPRCSRRTRPSAIGARSMPSSSWAWRSSSTWLSRRTTSSATSCCTAPPRWPC